MTPPHEDALRQQQPEHDYEFRDALIAGLTSTPKRIPSKYFYDGAGSKLFEQICALPEYYPTRTEIALLRRHVSEITALFGADVEIVEFGAGAIEKIRPLLDVAERPLAYIPVDISGPYLRSVAAKLDAEYPDLLVRPVVADFTQSLPDTIFSDGARRIGFFPGSTIGNLEPWEAAAFLRRARRMVGDDGAMVIGIDLRKDAGMLHAAYNDGAGVTAAFTLNLLRRMNRELDGNFNLAAFEHDASYNPDLGRIEIYFRSLRDQLVTVAGRSFAFSAGERVHTEYSYKYDPAQFAAAASEAGFRLAQTWTDPAEMFAVTWLVAG